MKLFAPQQPSTPIDMGEPHRHNTELKKQAHRRVYTVWFESMQN